MHTLGALVENVVLLAKNRRFSGGLSRKKFFWLFLSKNLCLGLFRNFLDHAIRDPRHHLQKGPVPPGSSYIHFFLKYHELLNYNFECTW